ncbi:hypothetical protein [Jannaschia rubra]|uniref:hypothetical protein n=1 Tax=Jannaschia rubra TaxID=282197 RepID=UPI0024933597|nr:hypothetical protein [Jannaschia rubra]
MKIASRPRRPAVVGAGGKGERLIVGHCLGAGSAPWLNEVADLDAVDLTEAAGNTTLPEGTDALTATPPGGTSGVLIDKTRTGRHVGQAAFAGHA